MSTLCRSSALVLGGAICGGAFVASWFLWAGYDQFEREQEFNRRLALQEAGLTPRVLR